ncbi:MAG: Gar1/Naf1 family protein [Candidatus Bathyarchaeia archaeon]
MKPSRRLGMVLHISSNSGNLILKAETSAIIGEPVTDRDNRVVGRVFDVFGPVSNPFVAVKPELDRPERLVGRPLYVRRPGSARSG